MITQCKNVGCRVHFSVVICMVNRPLEMKLLCFPVISAPTRPTRPLITKRPRPGQIVGATTELPSTGTGEKFVVLSFYHSSKIVYVDWYSCRYDVGIMVYIMLSCGNAIKAPV
jgi:hypothetical protein